MAVINNFPKFEQAFTEWTNKIRNTDSPEAQRDFESSFTTLARQIMRSLRLQTKREDWTNRITGKTGRGHIGAKTVDSRGVTGRETRPSFRHHRAGRSDGPIYQGWQFEFSGGSFDIQNTKRHMGVLLHGSKRHDIPNQPNGLLKFWRGGPLKWDAGNDAAGWNFRPQVFNHSATSRYGDSYLDWFEEVALDDVASSKGSDTVLDYVKKRIKGLDNYSRHLDNGQRTITERT